MAYRGKVKGGVVFLDDPDVLPDGAIVRVTPVKAPSRAQRKNRRTLSEKLLDWAGKAVGLPSDLARNHDHYVHGKPKK
jgi:hypothetical protein